MMTAELLATAVADEGPLRIDHAEYPEPEVNLYGPGWAFAAICPWRLLHHGQVILDPDDIEATELDLPYELLVERVTNTIGNLIGHHITAVQPSPANRNDPTFILTGDYRIVVEADTDLDPWVFRTGHHGTFVGGLQQLPDCGP